MLVNEQCCSPSLGLKMVSGHFWSLCLVSILSLQYLGLVLVSMLQHLGLVSVSRL